MADEGPRTFTADQAAARQAVYEGAADADLQIVGLADTIEVEPMLARAEDGSQVTTGHRVGLRMRIGADGAVLPRLEDAEPGGPPAVSLLDLWVSPDVKWDASGDAVVTWVAHARQVDVATARVFTAEASGPTRDELDEQIAGRPDHEVMNDPEFRDWNVAAEAATPQEAAAEVLGRLTGGGRIVQPAPPATPHAGADEGRDTGAAPPTATGAYPILTGMRLAWLLAILVVLGLAGFFLFSSDDDGDEELTADDADAPDEATDDSPTEGDDPDEGDTGETPPPAEVTGELLVMPVDLTSATLSDVVTWDVGATRQQGQSQVEPFTITIVLPPADAVAPGDPVPFAGFVPRSACDPGCTAEVYVFEGGTQRSVGAELGRGFPERSNTFLSDDATYAGVAELPDGCEHHVFDGSLPVHPAAATDFGAGLYRVNSTESAHTDTLFVGGLGPTPTPLAAATIDGTSAAAIRIAEDESTLPRDRCFFSYSHFREFPASGREPVEVAPFAPGVERTFLSLNGAEIGLPQVADLLVDQGAIADANVVSFFRSGPTTDLADPDLPASIVDAVTLYLRLTADR